MGRTLHLPLKAKWYEMIESGEKIEEYRSISTHWGRRLLTYDTYSIIPSLGSLTRYYSDVEIIRRGLNEKHVKFIDYTHVKFSWGYTKRTMTFECKGIGIGYGRPEWGAPEEEVFIIKLGKRVWD